MMRPGLRIASILLGGAVALLAHVPASAQDADSLRARYMIPLPPTTEVLSTVGRVSPGSSSGSPTAFGASWGDGFVGLSYQERVRNSELDDGAAVVGVGLGNSRDLVGLEVALTSFSTIRSDVFEVMAMSFKVHRVLPGNFGIAVGWESAVFLTNNEGDGGDALYGVVSKVWPQSAWQPFTSVTASVGVGNGRFRLEDDILDDEETVNLFGSVGVQLWEPVSAIVDWTGQDLSLGVSVVPFRGVPLVITPAVADITGSAGDGARFIIGAGMGFDFADVPRLFP